MADELLPSDIGCFVIEQSTIFTGPDCPPPFGPALLKTIKAYLYWQYQGDDYMQAFVNAYNEIQQSYLDWFNALNLPIYTQLTITSFLLDWVAQGLYGIARPVLGSGDLKTIGPLNTYALNTLALNELEVISNVVFEPVDDDIYKRVITWHFWKGDGKHFTIKWLKRRIKRFLIGTNGTAPNIDNTYEISISFGYPNHVSITLVTMKTVVLSGAFLNTFALNTMPFNHISIQVTRLREQFALARLLKEAIEQGVLDLPFQFTYDVIVQS